MDIEPRFTEHDYRIHTTDGVTQNIKRVDGAIIPFDLKNSDYQEYLKISDGYVIETVESIVMNHYYDENTGDLLGSAKSNVLIPYSHFTIITPPEYQAGKIANYNKITNAWSFATDSVTRSRARILRTWVVLGDPRAQNVIYWQMIYVDAVIRQDAPGQTQAKNMYNSLFPV